MGTSISHPPPPSLLLSSSSSFSKLSKNACLSASLRRHVHPLADQLDWCSSGGRKRYWDDVHGRGGRDPGEAPFLRRQLAQGNSQEELDATMICEPVVLRKACAGKLESSVRIGVRVNCFER